MFGYSGEIVLVVSRGDQVSINTAIGGWWGSRYTRSNVDMAFFPTAYGNMILCAISVSSLNVCAQTLEISASSPSVG